MVKGIATFWVSVPTPELASSPGSSTPSASVGFLQAHLWWYMAAAAITGVLVGGARMAWEQRGDAGKDVVRSLFVFVATVAGWAWRYLAPDLGGGSVLGLDHRLLNQRQ